MIQLQYYHKGLTKVQIEQILNNYKLKYTTLTNEINSKLNYLIKTVINDICPFLENIEEISKEINNLKDLDNHKKKIELLQNKLHEKSLVEHQLQNNIISLKKEISILKEKQINHNNSNYNIFKKNDISSSPKRQNRIRKKTFDLNISTDNHSISSVNSKKKYNNNKSDENSSKIITPNSHSKSTMIKKENPKNKNKNNYMMNMQEITRSLNGYHNQVKETRNNEKVNKFICFSNKKNNKKDLKNKEAKREKNKSMELSLTFDSITKNRKMKINNDINEDKNNYLDNKNKYNDYDNDIIDEEIEDEIKELEIDEQNILKLIEDIKNLGNQKEIV